MLKVERRKIMSSTFLGLKGLPPAAAPTKLPQDLPHGLLAPPERVAEIVAREEAKFPPEIFTPDAKERLTVDLTLQYYFEGPGYEVAYRSTPQGPEVLAVGWEEIVILRKGLPKGGPSTIHFWHP
jgi:hypothetical protein